MNRFKLSRKERIEVALALGWTEADGVGDNLTGCRPMRDSKGEIYAYMDEVAVPQYDVDILFMVRENKKYKNE